MCFYSFIYLFPQLPCNIDWVKMPYLIFLSKLLVIQSGGDASRIAWYIIQTVQKSFFTYIVFFLCEFYPEFLLFLFCPPPCLFCKYTWPTLRTTRLYKLSAIKVLHVIFISKDSESSCSAAWFSVKMEAALLLVFLDEPALCAPCTIIRKRFSSLELCFVYLPTEFYHL